MKLSELIRWCQAMTDKHGDLPVIVPGSVDPNYGIIEYWGSPFLELVEAEGQQANWDPHDAPIAHKSVVIQARWGEPHFDEPHDETGNGEPNGETNGKSDGDGQEKN